MMGGYEEEGIGLMEKDHQKHFFRKQQKDIHTHKIALPFLPFKSTQFPYWAPSARKVLILHQHQDFSSGRFQEGFWNLCKILGAGAIFYVYVPYLEQGICKCLARYMDLLSSVT